jgi:N-acyl-D-amino-acid deacylase
MVRPMTFDALVRGGTVIDGTGSDGERADLGISAGRIEAVGDLAAADAPVVIDATGKIVCPGLIDAHAHTDWCAFLGNEHAEPRLASIRQGVTTEIAGNCGLSPFPVVGRGDARMPPGWLFPSLREYRSAVEDAGVAVNVLPLVGHGAIRRSVMGDEARAATAWEIDAMKRLAAEAMDDGALGLSTALAMAPGAHAAEEELVALARVIGKRGGIYATHMREEGDHVLDSVRESIRLGEQAGVRVQISHHKIGGQRNWGRSAETLAEIEAARARGLDLLIDVYPWTATSNGLMDAMPHWLTDGGAGAARARLVEQATVDRLAAHYGDAPIHATMLIASCGPHPEYEGHRIGEVASELGCTVVETMARLLAADPGMLVITFGMDEAEVATIGSRPYALAGSDGLPFPGKQHPRVAGTFALLLGRAARGVDGATLADTIHRMTGLTAERFGLADRGVIRRGAVADVLVFDPETIENRATYDDPWLPPIGVEHVLLAGQVGVRAGVDTGLRAGRVLAPG